jgi:hypothetical protein
MSPFFRLDAPVLIFEVNVMALVSLAERGTPSHVAAGSVTVTTCCGELFVVESGPSLKTATAVNLDCCRPGPHEMKPQLVVGAFWQVARYRLFFEPRGVAVVGAALDVLDSTPAAYANSVEALMIEV